MQLCMHRTDQAGTRPGSEISAGRRWGKGCTFNAASLLQGNGDPGTIHPPGQAGVAATGATSTRDTYHSCRMPRFAGTPGPRPRSCAAPRDGAD